MYSFLRKAKLYRHYLSFCSVGARSGEKFSILWLSNHNISSLNNLHVNNLSLVVCRRRGSDLQHLRQSFRQSHPAQQASDQVQTLGVRCPSPKMLFLLSLKLPPPPLTHRKEKTKRDEREVASSLRKRVKKQFQRQQKSEGSYAIWFHGFFFMEGSYQRFPL